MSTLERLFSLTNVHKGSYCLDNIKLMIDKLGLSNFPKCIHVAGTNGKGSVCLKIANELINSGYKTGLFTSPHISSFRERVMVNHALIPEAIAYSLIEKILIGYLEIKRECSFFEVMTLLAFLYFKEVNVEFAVIETGLGGRLDTTNVVDPILTIITSISLDHTQILGSTLDQIALEKAGIIKENVPLVLGPKAILKPILTIAQEKNAKVLLVEGDHPFYDQENTSIARMALEYMETHLGLELTKSKTSLNKRPSCRFECIENMVFDVAHNPGGMDRLIEALQKYFPESEYRLVIGLSKDKDIFEILKKLTPIAKAFHLISGHQKLLPIADLENIVKIYTDKYSFEETIEKTVLEAKKIADANNEILVVLGSFYVMDSVKKLLIH